MDKEILFDIFKKAILDEHNASIFYQKAAQGTDNEEARSLFERFAAAELRHEHELEELYKTLKE